jgi:uncharacterized membrane-anchored protein YhcB (DUF1043 family)
MPIRRGCGTLGVRIERIAGFAEARAARPIHRDADPQRSVMSTQRQKREPSPAPPGDTAPKKRRNAWIWISGALALAAVGLLIWGLNTRSDLNGTQDSLNSSKQELQSTQQQLKSTNEKLASTQQELSSTQQQLDEKSRRQTAAVVSAGVLFTKLARDLGAANEDIAATEKELKDAQKKADAAQKDATAAKQQAATATGEAEKSKAQAEQANAEKEAAQAKATVVADCGKAYISAFAGLFEGGKLRENAPAVRKELGGITADCKTAFAGT